MAEQNKELINPYGLYMNIVHRSHIGGLKSGPYDDQTQGWWLPYYRNGELYLVDTYHINSPSLSSEDTKKMSRTDAFIKQRIEAISTKKDDSWTVSRANTEYYYGGSIKVTPDIINCFKEVCDLRNFSKVMGRNPSDYKPEDVVNGVQLWFEHAYPSGVSLLRDGAEKDINRVFENRLHDITPFAFNISVSEAGLKELDGYYKNPSLSEENKKRYEAFKTFASKCDVIDDMYKNAITEYYDIIESIEKDIDRDGVSEDKQESEDREEYLIR